MIHTAQKIWQLPLLLLALWLGGCAMQYEDEPVFVAPGDLTLLVNVHSGDRNVKTTRAEKIDEVGFEPTVLNREKINTLRIIIVRNSDRLIVHNDKRDLTEPVTYLGGLKYRVEYATEYTAYLIGNEAGLPETQRNSLNSDNMKAGKTFTAETLEAFKHIQIGSAQAGAPMITGTSTAVPMTEFFQITTKTKAEAEAANNHNNEGYIQSETFFITRAASKFSFYFFRAEDFTVDEDDPWTISKIKISGLGQSEYLFPKETQYYPTKENDKTSIERFIKAFELPTDASGKYPTDAHEFELTTAINVKDLPVKGNGVEGVSFIPDMYFPESKGTGYDGTDVTKQYKFDCTIAFGDEEYLDAVELPNLPNGLPRNTHVVVNVTINDRRNITATVDVIPFTAVRITTSDYGLPREPLTGYVIGGKDKDGEDEYTYWYDENFYEPVNKTDPPTKYYLGPKDNEGAPVKINDKWYMLVYADYNKPISDGSGVDYELIPGYRRTPNNLNHFFEVFITENGEETGQSPVKHLLNLKSITGYEERLASGGGWVDFYVNDWKQRVTLEDIAVMKPKYIYTDDHLSDVVDDIIEFDFIYPGTFNEWLWSDYGSVFWDGKRGYYPKYWFDILGNKYRIPNPPEFPSYPTYIELNLSTETSEWKPEDTSKWEAAIEDWHAKVNDWELKFDEWVESVKKEKEEKIGGWVNYLQGRSLM